VGFAIRDGYKAANGDQVMSIDSDFAMNPKDVKRVIERFKKGDCDMVIGSRFVKKSKLIKYPFSKWLANRIFHFVFRFLLGIKASDLSNNFKIMKKGIAKKIDWKSEGFSILAETGIMPAIMNYKICEVPVVWRQRVSGKSKFKALRLAPSYVKVALRAFYIKHFYGRFKFQRVSPWHKNV
jgi:dolichol-phosphate mannosyltransferase